MSWGFCATSRSLPDSEIAWSSTTPIWFPLLRPENQISFATGFQAIEEMIYPRAKSFRQVPQATRIRLATCGGTLPGSAAAAAA